jgi:hypothetical protein
MSCCRTSINVAPSSASRRASVRSLIPSFFATTFRQQVATIHPAPSASRLAASALVASRLAASFATKCLAENNKTLFESQFTSSVDAYRTDINRWQAKRRVNRHVEILCTSHKSRVRVGLAAFQRPMRRSFRYPFQRREKWLR